MSALPPLPNLAIRTLEEQPVDTTLLSIANDRKLVIDFWTTRCERCPEALSKLDELSLVIGKPEEVLFLSVCLDDEDFGKELVEEGGWENMSHAFMEIEHKEIAKSTFGFKSVPFIVLSHKGHVFDSGSPQNITIEVIQDFLEKEVKDQAIGGSNDTPIDISSESSELGASTTPEFTLDEDF